MGDDLRVCDSWKKDLVFGEACANMFFGHPTLLIPLCHPLAAFRTFFAF